MKGRVIEYMGIEFTVEYSKKFDKDLATVREIFSKGIENLTHTDRVALLRVYRPAYHESGKIEGITSYDSSATNCTSGRSADTQRKATLSIFAGLATITHRNTVSRA